MFSLVVVAKIKRKEEQDCENQVIQRIHNEAKGTRKRKKRQRKEKKGKSLIPFLFLLYLNFGIQSFGSARRSQKKFV